MLLRLDETSEAPKLTQIVEQVRQHIESAALRPGERLPSTRDLAERLGIHRSTVAAAYQELWAQGWIDLRPGTRPRVRARVALAGTRSVSLAGRVPWEQVTTAAVEALWDTTRQGEGQTSADIVRFSRMDMDPRLLPVEAFRSCLNRVLRRDGPALLGYGAPEGYGPLRAYLARRLSRHGIATTPDQILVTNGSQHALDLVFRLVATPGRPVIVESPTYDLALPLLRLAGLRPREVPVGPEGLDLTELEAALDERPTPALVYTMPTFHNPTGVSTSQAHRERLLALCEARGVPLLEDGFEEEMKYFGRAVLPIKSMDRQQVVLYCGTFSKVLFPGVRVGWLVAARPCLDRLTALRRVGEIAPSGVLQAALAEFGERGYYDLHLSRLHRIFRKRMSLALRLLRESLPRAWAEWQEPNGGYLVWLRLLAPAGKTPPDWPRLFAARGVEVRPGAAFFATPPEASYVRLSISTLDEDEIVAGVRRLAAAVADAHGVAPP